MMESDKAQDLQNPCSELRIVLLGKTGVGKSATGNTILGAEPFKVFFSASSGTMVCCKDTKKINGTKVAVIDTPGLLDPSYTIEEMVSRIKLCIPLSTPGPHVFLLVLQPGRFTKEDRDTVEIFLQIFGEEASKHTMILFTHGDKFEGRNVQEFVSCNRDLEKLFEKCQKRHHVLNNESKDDEVQVEQLYEKIHKMISENGGRCYTNEMLEKAESAIQEEKQRILGENEEQNCRELESLTAKYKAEDLKQAMKDLYEKLEREARDRVTVGPENSTRQQSTTSKSLVPYFSILKVLGLIFLIIAVGIQIFNQHKDDLREIEEELRIFLVGKTGVGKSGTGNTILGKKLFQSEISSSSVTEQCEKFHAIVNGRKVSVIDSPGLFDTSLSPDKVISRIKRCIPLSAPGPHVFLVVIQLGRFTEEEAKAVEIIQTIFGEEASKYTMALFTHGDRLKGKSIHKFVRNNSELVSFIKTCYGRYHVFNNEDKNPDQVIQLLDQIDKLVTGNGVEHYTSEMLMRAERIIEVEKQRILKEREEQRLKEIEDLKSQVRAEVFEEEKKKLEKKHEDVARDEAERNDSVVMQIVNLVYKYALKALLLILGIDKFDLHNNVQALQDLII